jgi:hypothetical protein
MTEKDALEIAKPTLKAVVDCIADGLFEKNLIMQILQKGFHRNP